MAERGLTRRLSRELLLQAAYISAAVLVSVFVAALLVQDVLIKQALQDEADYYWSRQASGANLTLPDTKNLTAYRHGEGQGVPAELSGLEPGYHRLDGAADLQALVSERDGQRLYLVFETEQVNELVTWFGLLPLALALMVVYISLYGAYRISRRAVSPVVGLARLVKQLDPAEPDAGSFTPDASVKLDDEIQVLYGALRGLIERVTEFAERERRFTRDASHELRTPLTVIKMATDRLLNEPELSDDAVQSLTRIRKSADDMERLTAAFLLLARESKTAIEHEWVCVNDVVAGELERLQILYPEEDIETELHEQHRLLVLAPEKVVESVLGNLLRNAFAYTGKGKVTVSISGDTAIIEDTGRGMDPEFVEQVFRPFFRNDRETTGFGVGMTIVKRMSDRFGWRVDLESEPGKGTRVSVQFPGARQLEATEEMARAKAEPQSI